MGARFYSPGTGRFTGRDPIGSLSPYAYCRNNSVNNIDPSGYYWVTSNVARQQPDYKKIMKTVVKALDKQINSQPASSEINMVCKQIKSKLGSGFEGIEYSDTKTSKSSTAIIGFGSYEGAAGFYNFGDKVYITPSNRNDSIQNVANTILHELIHQARYELNKQNKIQLLSNPADTAEETYTRNLTDTMIPPFNAPPPLPGVDYPQKL